MARPQKDVLELVASGQYRRDRHRDRLIEKMGTNTIEEAEAKAGIVPKAEKPKGGRPRKSASEHKRQHDYRRDRHHSTSDDTPDLIVADFLEALSTDGSDDPRATRHGLTPRRELMMALADEDGFDDPGVRSDGPFFAFFCETMLTLFEGAQFRGQPMILTPYWQTFFNEALSFDDDGRRMYETAAAEVPRKCAKSHTMAASGLLLGSPAEGEGAPDIVLASGTAKQAGELFDPAKIFVRRSALLRAVFKPMMSAIVCADNDGTIYKIAADGDTNYGQGPYIVNADELHVWTQPKQVSLWQALRSAFGAREDHLTTVISTAGWDGSSLFGEMHHYAADHPLAELREDMGGGGFILRDRQAKILYHCYAVAPGTPMDDLAAWKLANPAHWRTEERLAADLADPMLDESSKRRQYGNEWTSAESRWISSTKWAEAYDPGASPDNADWIPRGVIVRCGADAAITHDCTAVAWAFRRPDGKVQVRCRVWSVMPDFPAHVHVEGGRLDNEEAEAFVRDDLAKYFHVRTLTYDPRYFEDEAKHLHRAGLTVIEMSQNSTTWKDARQEFYKAVQMGRILHDGDSVLAAHVGAANGKRPASDAAWTITHDPEKPIDALDAVVMAAFLALREENPAPWSL